jgi:hypothetical protein
MQAVRNELRLFLMLSNRKIIRSGNLPDLIIYSLQSLGAYNFISLPVKPLNQRQYHQMKCQAKRSHAGCLSYPPRR